MGAIKEPAKTYEGDFAAWAFEQAAALERRDWDALDVPNLVEEVESMGKQQQADLTNHLAVLLAHLLKWQHQPALRSLHGRSWNLTVVEQRKQIAILMRRNRSLKSYVAEAMTDGYDIGRVQAARESDVAVGEFPATCPYTFERAMSADWMPD